MNLFDTTLRDGGNVVGHGFPADLTAGIVRGLLAVGIQNIEMGNCKGLGAYDRLGSTNALSDREYLEIVQPWLSQGRIRMFQLANCAREDEIKAAADAGLNFLRGGANASHGKGSVEAVKLVKKAGLVCRYSLMKAYVSTPEELAAATLKKQGYLPNVNLCRLLDYLDSELIPAMKKYDYHVAVNPTDLMLGLAGCHSNYLPMFRRVAEEGVFPCCG